jgi:hypothetical protein
MIALVSKKDFEKNWDEDNFEIKIYYMMQIL